MLSIAFICIVLLCGTFTLQIFIKRGFGETVAVANTSIVAILFIFGFFAALKAGTLVILILCPLLLIWDFIYLKKKKQSIRGALKAFFGDSSLYIYLISVGLFIYITRNHVAYAWDEFSHWANIVKTMTILDDFITNPASGSGFMDYPPGTALYQVFAEKLHQIFENKQFCEWIMYTSYYMLFFSFLMPVFEKIKRKTGCISKALTMIMLLVCPFFVVETAYRYVYVEMILTALVAMGFLSIIWEQQKDIGYICNLCAIEFMLVLVKGPGFQFALFLCLAILLDELLVKNTPVKKKIVRCIPFVVAAVLPKLLWNLELAIHKVESTFYQGSFFGDLLWNHNEANDYKRKAVVNYFKAMCIKTVPVGNTGIELNYTILFMLLAVAILWCLRKKIVKNKWTVTVFLGTEVVYILGLLYVYIAKLTRIEAEELYCFERYFTVVFLSMGFVLLISMIYTLAESGEYQKTKMFALCCVVFLMIRLDYVSGILLRNHVATARGMRADYQELIDTKTWGEDDRVLVVGETKDDYEKLMVRYCLKPAQVEFVTPEEFELMTEEYTGMLYIKP